MQVFNILCEHIDQSSDRKENDRINDKGNEGRYVPSLFYKNVCSK